MTEEPVDHEVPPSQCPRCFAYLDRAGETDSRVRAPGPGDISICLHCGAILMFDDDMKLVYAPDEKITIEAYALSLLYYKPIVRVWVDGDRKVH